MVVVSTLWRDVAASARIALMRSRTLHVCSRMSFPSSPVDGDCRLGWIMAWPGVNSIDARSFKACERSIQENAGMIAYHKIWMEGQGIPGARCRLLPGS